MKALPSTLAGWIVFDLFAICVMVLGSWLLKGEDLPQGVANIMIAVVSGFLGLLTGRAMEIQSNSTVKTETIVTTPPKTPTEVTIVDQKETIPVKEEN